MGETRSRYIARKVSSRRTQGDLGHLSGDRLNSVRFVQKPSLPYGAPPPKTRCKEVPPPRRRFKSISAKPPHLREALLIMIEGSLLMLIPENRMVSADHPDTKVRRFAAWPERRKRPRKHHGDLHRADIDFNASSAVSANIDTQSNVRHAGTTLIGQCRAGTAQRCRSRRWTRPDPAVSVPSAKLTKPCATAAAEPELEPPARLPDRPHCGARDKVFAPTNGCEPVRLVPRRGAPPPVALYDSVFRRFVGKIGAGRRRRRPRDIDIVFDGERDAPRRLPRAVSDGGPRRLLDLIAVPNCDEYAWIVEGLDSSIYRLNHFGHIEGGNIRRSRDCKSKEDRGSCCNCEINVQM